MLTGAPHLSPRYLRTGATRLLRNTLTTLHRPRGGWSPPPVLVVLNPTEACNLRCKMCFERGENMATSTWGSASSNTELSKEEYRAFIAEAATWTPTFYLTGGEPLLSGKTLDIVRTIKSHGLYVSMNTNGVLLRDNARELVESGLDKIILSLDGPPDVHNAIRGDTFDRIAEGLALVEELKAARHTHRPVIRAQCVISSHNLGQLDQTVDTVRALGIAELRFQHLMFAFSGEAFAPGDEVRAFVMRGNVSRPLLQRDAIDMALLKSQLAKLHNRQTPPHIRFEPNIKRADLDAYYRDPDHAFRNDCLSAWRRLVLSADGWIGPCQGMYLERFPDETALGAWNGQRFRELRRHILEKGLFHHCLRCCHREYYAQRIGIDVL